MNTKKIQNVLIISAALVAFSLPVFAARSADFIFVVDESGSMSGEQDFLQAQIPSIEAGLQGVSVQGSRYALVGFGAGDPEPHGFVVGSGQFGTVSDFQTAAGTLETSGGTEDGYAGILYALNNYTFRSGALPVIVLVTDEDRDVLDSASGASAVSILNALSSSKATLISILNQQFLDSNNQAVSGALVINSQNRIFIADGNGGFTKIDNGQLAATDDTTLVDYSQPTLQNGGLVADLNALREGGLTADSFTQSFIDSLIRTININVGLVELSARPAFASFSNALSPLVRNNAEVSEVFSQLSSGGDASFFRRVRVLQGESYPRATRSSIRGAYSYTFNLNARFDYMHREFLDHQTAGASGRANDSGPWSGFAQGINSTSDLEATATNPNGGSGNNWGALAGIDYAFSPKTHLGLALGDKETYETDGDAIFNSRLEGHTRSLTLYGSSMINPNFMVDGLLSYARAELDQARDLGGPVASSDVSQDMGSASLRIIVPMKWKGLAYGGTAQAQYLRVQANNTSETGAGALDLTVPAYDQDSVRTIVGGYAEHEFTVAGHRLVPRITAEWVHEYTDGKTVTAYFSGLGPVSSFTIAPINENPDQVRVTLGATYYVRDRTSIYANYLRALDNGDRTDNVINAGLNFGF